MTRNNPAIGIFEILKYRETLRRNGWLVKLIVSYSFRPSKSFSKYYQTFISSSIEAFQFSMTGISHTIGDPILKESAIRIEENLRQTALLPSTQKLPPTINEIEAFLDSRLYAIKFFFEDGHSHTVDLSIGLTCAKVIKELCNKFEIRESQNWALFERETNEDAMIRPTDYLGDVIRRWEMIDNPLDTADDGKDIFSPVKVLLAPLASFFGFGKTKSTTPEEITLPSFIDKAERSLVLRRHIFRSTGEKFNDPTEISLLYAQSSRDVHQEILRLSPVIAIQLAAFKLQITYGELDEGEAEFKM